MDPQHPALYQQGTADLTLSVLLLMSSYLGLREECSFVCVSVIPKRNVVKNYTTVIFIVFLYRYLYLQNFSQSKECNVILIDEVTQSNYFTILRNY